MNCMHGMLLLTASRALMASAVILKRIDDFELSLDNLAVLKIFAIENPAAGSQCRGDGGELI